MNSQTLRCGTTYKKCVMEFAVAIFDSGIRTVVSGDITTEFKDKSQRTHVNIRQNVSGPTAIMVLQALGGRLVGSVEVKTLGGAGNVVTTR